MVVVQVAYIWTTRHYGRCITLLRFGIALFAVVWLRGKTCFVVGGQGGLGFEFG